MSARTEEIAKKYIRSGTLHIDNDGGLLGAWFITYNDCLAALSELAAETQRETLLDIIKLVKNIRARAIRKGILAELERKAKGDDHAR